MIDQEEYLLLMKLNDIDKYNEIKKEKEKIIIKISMESIVKNVVDI